MQSIKLAEQFCREDGLALPERETQVTQAEVSVKKAKSKNKAVLEEYKESKTVKSENKETPIKQKNRIKMRKVGIKQKENSAQLLGSKRMKTESKSF